MEQAISLKNTRLVTENPGRFVLDTTFVLFFLALEIGISFGSLGFDGIVLAPTLAAFLICPYLLPFSGDKPGFLVWLVGRSAIAVLAVFAGFLLKNTAGSVLPKGVLYLPMTLLIVSGILFTATQHYGIIKIRLAR